MKQYQQNYYNSGKNCSLSITYLLCDTDEKFDYDKRNLDEYESKEHFTLEYIPMHNFLDVSWFMFPNLPRNLKQYLKRNKEEREERRA